MISWLPLAACNIHTDVFLSLNGNIIPNNSLLNINNIDSTDTTALLCITNRPPSSGSPNSGGNWFAPDGTRVGDIGSAGFERNRGPMVVRLRRTTGTAQGIYWCTIEDATSTNRTFYVGLYNSGGGMAYSSALIHSNKIFHYYRNFNAIWQNEFLFGL